MSSKGKMRYTIDFDSEEWAWLDEYSRATGVSKADIIREALRGFKQKNYIDLSKITLEQFEATLYVIERVVDVLSKFTRIQLKLAKVAKIEAEFEGFEKLAALVRAYAEKKRQAENEGKEEEASLLEIVAQLLLTKMAGEGGVALPIPQAQPTPQPQPETPST